MKVVIRQENENDYKQIYHLVEVAFQTAKVSNGKEQEYVNQLRNSGNYIPELALVAEDNQKLIGHIMLTKNYIVNTDCNTETLLLAPISVALEYRNKGIGSKLINTSFQFAKSMGYKSVILVGDPGYYSRFGFKKSADFCIRHEHIPEEYVLIYELVPNALHEVSGTVNC